MTETPGIQKRCDAIIARNPVISLAKLMQELSTSRKNATVCRCRSVKKQREARRALVQQL